MKPWSKADRDMARALRIWLDPSSVDTFKTMGYVPTAKQRQFHASTAHAVLLGGALGGGKSKRSYRRSVRAAWTLPGHPHRCVPADLRRAVREPSGRAGQVRLRGRSGSPVEPFHPHADLSEQVGYPLPLLRDRRGRLAPVKGASTNWSYSTRLAWLPVRKPSKRSKNASARPTRPSRCLACAWRPIPGDVGHMWLKNRFIDPTSYGQHPGGR